MSLHPTRRTSTVESDRSSVNLRGDSDVLRSVGADQPTFEECFEELFCRAKRVAKRLIGSEAAAEDVAAETLARAYLRWDRLTTASHRTGWVVTVAGNLAVDTVRRRRPVAVPEESQDHADQLAMRLALAGALRSLPRRQREVIVLRYLADLSEDEVASCLQISNGSVKTHAHRALRTLRRRLDDLRPLNLKEA